MRVLLVSNGFPPEGQWGTEFYTHQAAVGLAARGHIVRVFCPRREGEGERFSIHRSVRYGVGVHEVFHPPSRTKRFHESFLCGPVEERFEETLRELRPDVVHFTHFLWGLSSRLPRIARDAGARVVVTLTDFGILCHRGQLLDAVLDPCSGPAPDKCARCVRSLGPYDGNPLARTVRESLAAALAAVGGAGLVPTPGHLREREAAISDALDAAQLFIAPTQALADRLPPEVVAPERLRVLCYGLDERRFRPRPGPERRGPMRFGFLGQFQPHKGLDTLFRAVEILERRAIACTGTRWAGATAATSGRPGTRASPRASSSRGRSSRSRRRARWPSSMSSSSRASGPRTRPSRCSRPRPWGSRSSPATSPASGRSRALA